MENITIRKITGIFIILLPFIIAIYYGIQIAIIPEYKEYFMKFWCERIENIPLVGLALALIYFFVYVFVVKKVAMKLIYDEYDGE